MQMNQQPQAGGYDAPALATPRMPDGADAVRDPRDTRDVPALPVQVRDTDLAQSAVDVELVEEEPAPAPTRRRARTRSDSTRPYVESVKVSKGTWAFRLRWKYAENDRPIIYVDRVSDEVYDIIKKEYHSEYKENLVENYQGPVPARKPAARDTGGNG